MSSLPFYPQDLTRDDIDRLVGRGRQLQGEALRSGFRQAVHYLFSGFSLRRLRIIDQRQPCS